jgi:hypothetical protein
MTTLCEKIEELIELEVKKQVQEALSNYADMISKSYKIPLSLLLRDIPTIKPIELDAPSSSTTCLGLRTGNKRCKMNGKYDGYCRHHFTQKQKTQPIKIVHGEVSHTHGFPPMYQEGCPACVKPVEIKKPLIDFKLAF